DFPIDTLHIIGGGSQNNMLNRFTANAIGIAVVAGPSEATAIGNILLQAKAFGLVKDKNDIRKMVRNSIDLVRIEPEDTSLWDKHYSEYLNVFKEL
ncbi:MAG: FGGY-family carbohydrate kinase, partial [Petrimonas sp.]|nr:FGGY-family carbohydrate kinase [Petrimonas sp.]